MFRQRNIDVLLAAQLLEEISDHTGEAPAMDSVHFAFHISLILLLIYFAAKAVTGKHPLRDGFDLAITVGAGFMLAWAIKDDDGVAPLTERQEQELDFVSEITEI